MLPNERGYFGEYGGRYVPEILMPSLIELERALEEVTDETFYQELNHYLRNFAGRPTPLFFASNLSKTYPGLEIYLKREDLVHTGAHKINNTLGQALLAQKMGKTRLIAETGAGQHGVATAAVASQLGMEATVFMGVEDVKRQAPNVQRMELLGAQVKPVDSGSGTLKEATGEAIRDWVAESRHSHYVIGSVVGPHPYPKIVREFQKIIGREVKEQFEQKNGGKPHALLACVGGGSNALGMFYPFLQEEQVELYGIEAAGYGLHSGHHAATLRKGKPGVLHGAKSYLLQDANGQVNPVHSISAGLDYPGVGPEHSHLKDAGAINYHSINDQQALKAFYQLCRTEGIIPALESAHALAYLDYLPAPALQPRPSPLQVVVCLSGRGDKDLNNVTTYQETMESGMI